MNEKNNIEIASDTPRLKELQDEISTSITQASWYYERCITNDDTRFCIWNGQSDDARKHKEDIGEPAFPWEGASDARIRTADMLVNEDVRVMKAAFFRGKINALGTEAGDLAAGQNVAVLMKWMLHTHMAHELRREVELLAQWRQSYGAAVCWTWWDQQTRLELKKLNLQQIQQAVAQSGDPAARQMLDALFDPLQTDALAEMFQRMAPGLTLTEARAVIEDLHTKGEAEFPQPYIFKNKPKWEALRPMVDVFFPVSTADLQRARFIARREWLTETELRDRVEAYGWDKKFVEEALKHKGTTSMEVNDTRLLLRDREMGFGKNRLVDDYQELVEIFHVYYKAMRRGTPAVYCSVLHSSVKDQWGKHEMGEYQHGEYPFRELVREFASTSILESRGIPEIVDSHQREIKTQRDYRADRSSIAILPPVKVPANRGKMKLLFGPAVQVSERRPGEISWMQPPPFDQGTIEIERATRGDVNEYFGRATADVAPTRSQLYFQDLVDGFLRECSLVGVQSFQLMQQYMSDVEVSRVVGVMRRPFQVSRAEIQGKYDLAIEFDVRDLDTEFLAKKLDMIGKMVVPLDTAGVLDRAELVSLVMGAIDPQIAERVVRDYQAVTAGEVEDEQVQFAKLSAGVEPVMKEGGQNAQLRMQVLQNIIQSNPDIQGRLGQDKVFASLVENRMKHFQFQLQQQQNAQIGRIGVAPALGMSAMQ